jgi:PKD repeat protein
VALAVVAASGACGGGNGGAGIDTKPIKSARLSATAGGTVEVSCSESAELFGASLVVPPAALAGDTTITVALGLASIVGFGAEVAGPVAVWGPPGTRFRAPATMTLPYRLPAGRSTRGLFVLVLESDGKRYRIEQPALQVDAAQRLVRFPVKGFSAFQPGVVATTAESDATTPPPDAAVDAPAFDAPPYVPTDSAPPAACVPLAPTATGLPRIPNGDFENGQTGWSGPGCATFPVLIGCHGRVLRFGPCSVPEWQLAAVDPCKISSLRVRMDLRLELAAYFNGAIALRVSTGTSPDYDGTLIGQHDFEISPESVQTLASRKGPLYVDDDSLTGKSLVPVHTWVSFTSQDIKPLLPAQPHMLRIQLSGTGMVDNVALVSDDPSTPIVSFEAAPRALDFPLPVDFFGGCTDAGGACSGYRWSIVANSAAGSAATYVDQEITASGLAMSYTFTPMTLPERPRTIFVAFTADDDKGAARSFVRELSLLPYRPVSMFQASPGSGVAPLKVTFTYVVSEATSLVLDFGDGTKDGPTSYGPSASGMTVRREHVYQAPGTYQAKILASASDGSVSTPASVSVRATTLPMVSITPTPSSGSAPLSVQFTAKVTAPDTTIVGYAWDFGDGATANTASPSHAYPQPGTFQVKLTVTDDVGSKASANTVIFVQ